MVGENLSSDLVIVLHRYFSSVRQLEVLLFLHSRRNESFTAKEVNQAAYSDQTMTEKWLTQFCERGLVGKIQAQPLPKYQYRPGDSKVDQSINKVAVEYKVRPAKVITALMDRTAPQMLSFMDAFKLKKGDEGDDR